VDKEQDVVVSIIQDSVPVVQRVNGGGTSTININQK
jgi:hypothetical protein